MISALSGESHKLPTMVAVAPIALADSAIVHLRRSLERVHGVTVQSAERVSDGIELRLTAHSVQAAEWAEYTFGGLEPGQFWTERAGLLTLSLVLGQNV